MGSRRDPDAAGPVRTAAALRLGDPFFGSPAELPENGTYKVVLYNRTNTGMNVTLWNLVDAPAEAKTPPENPCNYAGPKAAASVLATVHMSRSA